MVMPSLYNGGNDITRRLWRHYVITSLHDDDITDMSGTVLNLKMTVVWRYGNATKITTYQLFKWHHGNFLVFSARNLKKIGC